ncbi:MAG: amidase [Ktedonobacterales bacterium]
MSASVSPDDELETTTIPRLQTQMAIGELTALQLVQRYLERIEAVDRHGPSLRSIIEVNPDAEEIAYALDRERVSTGPRGLLHGIPILLKDNIETADRVHTSAGSLALAESFPQRDAFTAERLRAAGAILLGKTNMSEWANFRSSHSSSGWSARGGQTLNPHALDRTPCGSSSGSAAAVAAALSVAALGTETDGSILCPASANGVVGLKPTVGLVSRSGVVPIAHSQDTVGPFGRSVADVALVLGVISGPDPRDVATRSAQFAVDYTAFLDAGALNGARIGIAREIFFGYSANSDAVAEAAIEVLRTAGAQIVDPANIATAKAIQDSTSELTVLLYEFNADLNAYLAVLPSEARIHSLLELIEFNNAHRDQEMPYFGQEYLEMALAKGPLSEPEYRDALSQNQRLAREEGIDAVMDEHHLDALMMPTGSPAWKIDLVDGDHGLGGCSQPAALAGYPAISIPAGYPFGLPVGITLMGRAFSEPRLIALAYAFEQATKAYRPPRFAPSSTAGIP